MSPAAAELSGLDKPACPQPRSWSPECSGAGKGEVTGIQIPQGQEQGTKGISVQSQAPPGEMGLAQTLPVVFLQGQTFWRAPGKALWNQREQQGWRCCCSPFPVMFPRSSRACLGSALPSSPAPKDSVHLLWIRLEAAPGSGSDET